ncbi:lysophospholipid acyltransferase family protein [Cyanobium sp. ATX 6A2]|uniref:lysophospholipid acyltransferase family protein n=1 Tax=Cyanobium sp. ATX 6A2 TaxID=2823700 RepID=UPI0020CF6A3D|nr:lysophospholipid acyltransferase family protein [Cyanobium sp. ATX 6A2]MCP9887634.1 lysophospholipid acyltransferase family protein [Cyanobium sp. ATX 6A2]
MNQKLPQPIQPAARPARPRRRWIHASRRQRLRWWAEALLLRLLLLLLRGRRHHSIASGIRQVVRLGQPALGRRLATAEANLERVYGTSLSPGQRQLLARRSLESFFLSCLESIIEPVQPSRIHAEGEGLEPLLAARQPNQGVIIASLHLGCWDLGLRWLSQRLEKLAVVYRPAHNPQADRLLNAARRANSQCHWISQFDVRSMLEWLRRGGALVVMTDLYGGQNPLPVDVLGLSTHALRTPLALSQKTNAPIYPVAHVREDNGRFQLSFGWPLTAAPGVEGLVQQAQALADWQEPLIQAYAEQYYWIQRRWRTGDGSGTRLRTLAPPAPRALAAAAARGRP